MGAAFEFGNGHTVTVHSAHRNPAAAVVMGGRRQQVDMFIVDAEMCAGQSPLARGVDRSGNFGLFLVANGETSIRPGLGRGDLFVEGERSFYAEGDQGLGPDTCIRGPIIFRPSEGRPSAVLFDSRNPGLDVPNAVRVHAAWTIPE